MRSLFAIILAMLMSLNSVPGVQADEETLLANLSPDCESVAAFIEDHFALFVEKYNEESDDGVTWSAECVEGKTVIEVFSFEQSVNAIFLDFSGDDGYAVLGDDYLLYDFQTAGEAPIKGKDADSFAFSVFGGYLYKLHGKYYSVNEENNSTQDFWESADLGKQYKGQDKDATGCGKIIHTDEYVNDKYGSGWTLASEKSLPMKGYKQTDLSVYKENIASGSGWYSEGNCWVVAAYHVLQYYADNYTNKMPGSYDMTEYDPKTSESKIYRKYYDSKGNNISGTLKGTKEKKYKFEMINPNAPYYFSALWCETRMFVSDRYGKINNGNIWQTENIIKSVSSNYGYTISTEVRVDWRATCYDVMLDLIRGDVFIWSTSNDTYGSHTMAGCGYRLYSKRAGFWIFAHDEYKLFFELRDGHSDEPRYYDVQGHVGLSAIIFLNGNKKDILSRPGVTNVLG